MTGSAKKYTSLKFRLMLMISLALLMVVGIPVWTFVHFLNVNYNDFSTNMIETTSQVVYQFIYDGMMKNDSTIIQKNLELLALDPSIVLVRLYRPDGQVLYSSNRQEISENVQNLNFSSFSLADGEPRELFIRNQDIYSHHHLIRVEKECTSCHTNEGSLVGILDVHASFTNSDHIYSSSKNLAIFGGLIIIVILWIFLNFIYQSLVESRLRLMTEGFEKLSSGNFKYKLTMPGKDELSLLADKFNQMVENLDVARYKEDQFFQERLQRADRLVTLGEVAAEIAHEVNNPAGIILTRAEYLKDEISEMKIAPEVVEDLEIIIQQIKKIADTTHSILHYSRKLTQSFSETDLNALTHHSLKVLEPRINNGRVTIQLELPDQPALVWGSVNQLEQVWCNLINNSLDFISPESGIISIRIQNYLSMQNNRTYRVIFQDNGPGILPHLQNHIFSPFFTTKEKDKGTGLGLFIVRNIISNHKGTIRLDTDYRSGTRFIIELEAYEKKA